MSEQLVQEMEGEKRGWMICDICARTQEPKDKAA